MRVNFKKFFFSWTSIFLKSFLYLTLVNAFFKDWTHVFIILYLVRLSADISHLTSNLRVTHLLGSRIGQKNTFILDIWEEFLNMIKWCKNVKKINDDSFMHIKFDLILFNAQL
jgi:hypothetical protein